MPAENSEVALFRHRSALRNTARAHLLVLTLVSAVLLGALPAGAADDIVVSGGGGGHGSGMPQYGARAMADSGSSAEEILEYFYEGVEIGNVGSGEELTGHADPLQIGVAQELSQTSFSAVGGCWK